MATSMPLTGERRSDRARRSLRLLRRRRLLIPALALAALVAGGIAVMARRSTDVQYRTSAATLGTVTQSLSLSGNLAPVGETDLGFGSSGRVLTVSVQTGQNVKAGDVLARLDTSTLQGNLTQARASLQSAEARLSLDQAGPTPQALAQAQGAVTTANVQLTTAETALNDTQTVNGLAVSQAQQAEATAQNAVTADQNALTADAGTPQRSSADQQALARRSA